MESHVESPAESYAESCAENWVRGIIPLDSEHLHKREEKEGSFYGYREKTDNFDPEVDA